MTKIAESGDLLELLAKRHVHDVFVRECKDGPTWHPVTGTMLRLDAWAMPKSWAPWTCIGYEIKVSRSDFLKDAKHRDYWDLCHELYFVCPSRLIRAEELPQGVGLLWAAGQGTGARLISKMKATHHEPDAKRLSQLMAYVLMSRARIVANMHAAREQGWKETCEQRTEMYRRLVEDATARKDLARFVAQHIRDRVTAADTALDEAAHTRAWIERELAHMKKLGIVWDEKLSEWRMRGQITDQLARLTGSLPISLGRRIKQSIEDLQRLSDVLDELRDCTGA